MSDKIIDAKAILESGYAEAETLINDKDKMERFLQRLEAKLKEIPGVGEQLSNVPVLVSLVKSYVQGEFKDVPIGTIVAVVSALIYFLSPVDIIPDTIPGLGYVDDAAVIALCWKLVSSDVEEYKRWRERNGKVEKDVFED